MVKLPQTFYIGHMAVLHDALEGRRGRAVRDTGLAGSLRLIEYLSGATLFAKKPWLACFLYMQQVEAAALLKMPNNTYPRS